jgi:nicotinamidase-related amidase
MDNKINKQNTALLVMDVQGAIVKMVGNSAPMINSINKAISHARANNILVIFVVIGFRKGYPEMSPDNRSFAFMKANPNMSLDNEEGYKVHESIAKEPNDIIVTKKRVSAFTGSDLEVVLRSLGIRHLVLTGFATSGVVLSTLREAADKDYVSTVLADCCADRDEEVHRVLTTKVFTRQADVMTADEWCNNA